MGHRTKEFDFPQFRKDQEAAIHAEGYAREELFRLFVLGLTKNQLSLLEYSRVVDLDSYESAADQVEDLFVTRSILERALSEFERLGDDSTRMADYSDFVRSLIATREIQVVMNRALGNYHVPGLTPVPVYKPSNFVQSPSRGTVWGAAAFLAFLGFGAPHMFVVAIVVFLFGLTRPVGEDSGP